MQKREANHGSSIRLIPLILRSTVVVLSLFYAAVKADNSVHLECPVYAPDGGTDSIGIRVFVANDSALFVYTLGFWLYTDDFVFTSATPGPAIMLPNQNGNFLAQVFPPDNQIAVAWYAFLPQMPYPPHPTPAHAFTLWIRPTSPYSGGCADIDSGYVQRECYWRFMVHGSHKSCFRISMIATPATLRGSRLLRRFRRLRPERHCRCRLSGQLHLCRRPGPAGRWPW